MELCIFEKTDDSLAKNSMTKLCRALFEHENKIKLVAKICVQLFSSLKWDPVYKKVMSWAGPRNCLNLKLTLKISENWNSII